LFSKIVFWSKDPDEILVGAQTEFYSGSYLTTCYVKDNEKDYRQFVTVTIEPDTSLIKLSVFLWELFLQALPLELLFFRKKTLGVNDNLDIYYNYKEYKGISSKTNLEWVTSYIDSKLLYNDGLLRIMTNGPGKVNSADLLPKKI